MLSAALFACAACAGCSLLASLDGFSGGGGDDGGAGEAGIVVDAAPRDGPGADAPSDATSMAEAVAPGADADAGGVPDAPQDGPGLPADAPPGQEAEAGPSTFCSSPAGARAVFCEDFDRGPLPGAWSEFNETGGTLALDSTSFVSAPSSLAAVFSAMPAGQPLNTDLRRIFALPAPSPTTFSLDFELRPILKDVAEQHATLVASLDFVDAAGNRYTIQFAMIESSGNAAMRLEEQSGFVDGGSLYMPHPLPDTIMGGAFTHVSLIVTLSSTPSAHVAFNGKTQIDAPLQVMVKGISLQLGIGSAYQTAPSSGWKLLYDNVTLAF